MSSPFNIIGKKFNRLLVIRLKEKRKSVKFYECLCDCGNTCDTTSQSLRKGYTKSCGCIKKEKNEAAKNEIVGKKFSRLTVEKFHNQNGNAFIFECVCECGNRVLVNKYHLKRKKGNVQSCGCLLTETNSKKLKDLTGKRFDRLLVLEFIGFGKYNHAKYKCQCDCGKIIETVGRYLVEGTKRSCNCLQSETAIKLHRKPLTEHRKANLCIKTAHRKQLSKAINQELEHIEDLGCTVTEFKEYITLKFQPGMTWDNHGRWTWHIDHVIPLAKFDLTDPVQRKIAFHYTNMQPLWALDNIKKGHK